MDALPELPENLQLGLVTVALVAPDRNGTPLTPETADAEVASATAIWEKFCGISLAHRGHLVVDSKTVELSDEPRTSEEVEEIQKRFYDAHYIVVTYVRDIRASSGSGDGVAGQSDFPWDGDKGIVIGRAGIGDGVLAHELGHYFGLKHVNEDGLRETLDGDAYNVMFPAALASPNDQHLLPVQCEVAKKYILEHGSRRDLCRPLLPPEKRNCPPVQRALSL